MLDGKTLGPKVLELAEAGDLGQICRVTVSLPL